MARSRKVAGGAVGSGPSGGPRTGGARRERGKAPRRGPAHSRRRTRFDWLANLRQRRVAAAVALTVALLFVISMFLGFGVGGFSPAAFRGREATSGGRAGTAVSPSPAGGQSAPAAASGQAAGQAAGAGNGGGDTVGNVLPSLPKFPPAPQPAAPPSPPQPTAPASQP